MAWIKLDDQFIDHPKVIGLSDAAFRLWLAGLSWSARHYTDGHLSGAGVSTFCAIRCPVKAARELVDAGLWEENGVDYLIHDYLEYQPKSNASKELRKKRSAAGAAGGVASGVAKRKQSATGATEAKPNPEPEPVIEPEPERRDRGGGTTVAPVKLKPRSRRPGIEQVAEHYCQRYPKNRAQVGRPEALDLINARLADHDPDDLCRAIDGMRYGDKGWYFDKGLNELARVFKDEAAVGKFMALADSADAPILSEQSKTTVSAAQNFVRKKMAENDQ